MSKPRHQRRNRLNRLNYLHLDASPPIPESPVQPEGADKTRIHVVVYGPGKFQEQEISQPEELRHLDLVGSGKSQVLWVRVVGVKESEIIRKIGDIFLLHELAIEDVMNVQQRSKVEPYGDHLFMVMRCVALDKGALFSEQLSLFLDFRTNVVITFEERVDIFHCLDSVLERLRKDAGRLRSEQADYLLYTIVDNAIDGFFPVVEAIGDAVETLEDEIIDQHRRLTPARIHELKREVVNVRRAIWPMRDALNVLTREDSGDLLSSSTRVYLRDCYDHTLRIMDLVETQREMCADLMDLYLSSVSNKMNEIIKVLTIVTLLFMPPTLVAGIYGMNFKIPEYKWQYGYGWALLLMLITSGVVWLWAHRCGWLSDDTALK
jgi:magnesium transporter